MPEREEAPALRSFEGFFAAEHGRLFGALCISTRDRHEAEEIMQEAFVRVWERWDRVVTMDDPIGYLYRTSMNVLRSRQRRALVALRRAVKPTPMDDVTAAIEARVQIAQTMASLSPTQRAAIVLTNLLDFSAEEAAAMLGMKAGAVRTLASRGRSKMREQVGDPDEG